MDPVDPHSEGTDLSLLFGLLNVAGTTALVNAMLSEQRIIFISSDLARLSASIHAAVGLLCAPPPPADVCTHAARRCSSRLSLGAGHTLAT